MSAIRTRVGAAVAGSTLVALALAPAAHAGPAVAPTAPARDAAGFVAATLAAGGDHYVYPKKTDIDGGNTIDAILALDAARVGRAEAARATAYLAAHLGSYIGSGTESYAGATAKALLAVEAQGENPASFGGTDLVSTLLGLEKPTGRFSDRSTYGDYSTTIGQSLAVIGLTRAGAPLDAAAVTFLLDQKCPDGGFRSDPGATACTSDPDTTGFAAQALLAVSVPGVDTGAAARAALGYLAARQESSGGVASATGGVNANTTAVAAQAFAAGGRSAPLALAQRFLASLQYGCSSAPVLRGGIAVMAAKRTAPTATAPSDSDLRATPQATLALAGGTLATVTAAGASAAAPTMACSASPATSGADVRAPVALGIGLLLVVAAALTVGPLARRRGRGA